MQQRRVCKTEDVQRVTIIVKCRWYVWHFVKSTVNIKLSNAKSVIRRPSRRLWHYSTILKVINGLKAKMIQNKKKPKWEIRRTGKIFNTENEKKKKKKKRKKKKKGKGNEEKKEKKLKKENIRKTHTQMKWSGKQDALYREEANYLYCLKMNEQSRPIVRIKRMVQNIDGDTEMHRVYWIQTYSHAMTNEQFL